MLIAASALNRLNIFHTGQHGRSHGLAVKSSRWLHKWEMAEVRCFQQHKCVLWTKPEWRRHHTNIAQTLGQDSEPEVEKFKSENSARDFLWFIFCLAGFSFTWHHFMDRTWSLDVWVMLESRGRNFRNVKRSGEEKLDAWNCRETWVSNQFSACQPTETLLLCYQIRPTGYCKHRGRETAWVGS